MARVTQWNADKLLRRVPLILTNYGIKVTPLLQESIKAEVYEWPTTTRRKNGETVGSPRNIVDTGELLRSQSAPKVQENRLTITWGAPYSGEVLRGEFLVGTLRNAYIAPGRDWITPVLRSEEPMRFFVKEWRKIGGA